MITLYGENLKEKIKQAYKKLTEKTSEDLAKKLKYSVETPVIIYQDTPMFEGGSVGIILERDPFTTSYAVVDLKEYYEYEGDASKLLQREAFWVAQQDLTPINFIKPVTILERIKNVYTKMVTCLKNWRPFNRR